MKVAVDVLRQETSISFLLRSSWRGLDFRLIFGLACVTAQTLCSITNQIEIFSGISYFDFRGFLACCIISLILIAGVAMTRSSEFRRAMLIINSLIACVWAIDTIYCLYVFQTGGNPGELALLLFTACIRITSMVLTIQWSLHVALKSEKDVMPNVSLALIIAVIFYILACQIGGFIALCINCLLLLISCALLIAAEFGINDETVRAMDSSETTAGDGSQETSQSLLPSLWIIRGKLFGSRVVWGILFGLLITAVSVFPPPLSNGAVASVLLILVLLAVCITILLLIKMDKYPSVTAVFIPMLLAGVIFIGFYAADGYFYARVFAAICHISWFAQMFYQMPTYRQLLRMNPAVFSYVDRLCSFVTFELVTWFALSVPGFLETLRSSPTLVFQLTSWYTVALIVMSVATMTKHFMSYFPSRKWQNADHDKDIDADDVKLSNSLSDIAAKYGLTSREEDVIRLLAEGYSKQFIQQSLIISEGTVKTHVRNIYTKLGVSSRDELIKLVNQ